MKIIRSSVQRVSKDVAFSLRSTSAGSVDVVATGEGGVQVTILRLIGGDQRNSGQIRRMKNVPASLGFVLTDEGRVAVAAAS